MPLLWYIYTTGLSSDSSRKPQFLGAQEMLKNESESVYSPFTQLTWVATALPNTPVCFRTEETFCCISFPGNSITVADCIQSSLPNKARQEPVARSSAGVNCHISNLKKRSYRILQQMRMWLDRCVVQGTHQPIPLNHHHTDPRFLIWAPGPQACWSCNKARQACLNTVPSRSSSRFEARDPHRRLYNASLMSVTECK